MHGRSPGHLAQWKVLGAIPVMSNVMPCNLETVVPAPQYSLRGLLVFIAVVAAYFPCSQIYNAWCQSRIRSNHSYHYVELVLLTKLRNGQTLQDVSAHFDDVRLVTANDVHVNRNIARVWGNKGLTIAKGDQFYFCSVSAGAGGYLQFRQGKLVNLWNTAYTTPGNLMKAQPGQMTRPSQLLTYGFLFGYFALVATGTITIQILRKMRIERGITSKDLTSRACEPKLKSSVQEAR